jgi:hypothetical protein
LSISELKTSVKPHFSMASNGTSINVRRTEYVGDVLSDTAGFQLDSYVLTPINSTLFPWLCGIAARYETYSFQSVSLHYCPTASAMTQGMVGMAAEFDASDDDPQDKHQFLNIVPADRASVWAGQSIHLSRRDLNVLGGVDSLRYTGNIMSNDELLSISKSGNAHTTLAGRIFMMMQDVPPGVAGEMWIEYNVALAIPDYSPICEVPPPLLLRTTFPRTWANLFDGTTLQSLEGVSVKSGVTTDFRTLLFSRPGQYYRLDICTNATQNVYNATVRPQTEEYKLTIKPQHKLDVELDTHMTKWSTYVKTLDLSNGGPTSLDPAWLEVSYQALYTGEMSVGVSVRKVTKVEYDNSTTFHSEEKKSSYVSFTPADVEDDPCNSEADCPSECSMTSAGWVRASSVLKR